MTDVTDADRRAATEFANERMTREGITLVQSYARHREASIAPYKERERELVGLLKVARRRISAIADACGDYLPPDSGITEHDLVNTVIGLTDDAEYCAEMKVIDAAIAQIDALLENG